MKNLQKMTLLVPLFLISTLAVGQKKDVTIKCHLTNCKTAQTLKLYYLGDEFGSFPLLVDSTIITGINGEETISLQAKLLGNKSEYKYLLSITPLGMDIDILLGKTDEKVTLDFAIPEPDTEAIYTTQFSFLGSQKADEFSRINNFYWVESIAAGKRYQSMLRINVKAADSLHLISDREIIERALLEIDSTTCLICGRFSFYKIIAVMRNTDTYFSSKLFSRLELQNRLESFKRRFQGLQANDSFVDISNDINTIEW
jgi:hypothetical protein